MGLRVDMHGRIARSKSLKGCEIRRAGGQDCGRAWWLGVTVAPLHSVAR
jgi:hypothetical protein